MDIQAFFDHVDHDLMVKAVEANTDLSWVVLYVKRWLTAPLALPDGTVQVRERGTPQGSAVSPVLANLFLHYAFDAWMAREYPSVPFERYVDDAVVHCVSKAQAERLTAAIRDRLAGVGLTLHPTKTRIVYCKDQRRDRDHEHTSFDFLGFTFRARGARRKDGTCFASFMPAVSKDALKRMSEQVRSWRLHRRTGHNLTELAARINPIIRGWMNYYGSFYRSALSSLWSRINGYLLRWIRHKYDRLRPFTKAKAAWKRISTTCPAVFAHWRWCRTAW